MAVGRERECPDRLEHSLPIMLLGNIRTVCSHSDYMLQFLPTI